MINMTAIQTFLRSGKSCSDLYEEHRIYHRTHPRYPNLFQFNYDIRCDWNQPMVIECRSIILDRDRDWEIVARPFDKFFNAHQGFAAKIDWSTAKILDKLDGSMAIRYHYDGQWHWATRGMPDAGGNVNGVQVSFYDLFQDAYRHQKLEDPEDTDLTVLYEYTAPCNRVVVYYDKPKLTVIGGRYRDGTELLADTVAQLVNGEAIQSYTFSTMEETVSAALAINANAREGFVVIDNQFNRIKIKSPDYCARHQLKSSWSLRNAIELIQLNRTDDIQGLEPHYAENLNEINKMIMTELGRWDDVWKANCHIDNRKEFAMAVKNTKASAYCFAKKDNKVQTPFELLAKMQPDKIIELIPELTKITLIQPLTDSE